MTTVIFETSGLCNLACKYCCNEDIMDSTLKIMPLDLVQKAVTLSASYEVARSRSVSYLLFGGEALLSGIGYIKQVQGIIQKVADGLGVNKDPERRELELSIQSNGTLVTREMAEEFNHMGVTPGFSMDGVGEVHDRTRVDKAGKGSFSRLEESLGYVRDAGLHTGVICVVNPFNIADGYRPLLDLYDYCREQEIGLQLNHLSSVGGAVRRGLSITPQQYQEAVIALFERVITDDKPVDVHPIDYIMHEYELGLLNNRPLQQLMEGDTGEMDKFGKCCFKSYGCQDPDHPSIFFVDRQGDVYPCDTLAGKKEYRFGNVYQISDWREVAECDTRMYLAGRNQRLTGQLQEAGLPYAGCLADAIRHSGQVDTIDPFAPAYNAIRMHIFNALDGIFKSAMVQSTAADS